MQTSPLKFLPLILVILTLGSAAFFFTQRNSVKEKINKVYTKLPEPTVFVPVKRNQNEIGSDSIPSITPTVTPTATPTVTPIANTSNQPNQSNSTNSSKKVATTTTRTSTTIVCTPVYGMANSCAEHTVVDTGLETSAFYNLAALSYVGGLAAFIKAKRKLI